MAQLRSHVGIGLSNGLTEVEIREAMLHVAGYCGFPSGLDAWVRAAAPSATCKDDYE